jgi:tight adherence protein B
VLTIALPVLAVASLCWPLRPAVRRLPGARESALWQRFRVRLHRPQWPGPVVLAVLTGAPGWLLGGFGVGIGLAIATGTTRSRWQARTAAKRRLSAAGGLADAIRALAAELRAGAHPAEAAESAAIDAPEPAATVLTTVAATARLGGDIGAALHRRETEIPGLSGMLGPVAHAWSLADRHGLPLARVLDLAGRDLDGRVRFARQVQARMAGPRASAAVLAGLPLLGLLLGEGMGAQPVHVLLATGIGQLLLAVGVALTCVGIRWTAHLTEHAVLP